LSSFQKFEKRGFFFETALRAALIDQLIRNLFGVKDSEKLFASLVHFLVSWCLPSVPHPCVAYVKGTGYADDNAVTTSSSSFFFAFVLMIINNSNGAKELRKIQ